MSQTGQMEVGAEQTNKSLQGKVAIVTGASTGIGKAIAIEMAHRGASVVVNYIGKPDAAQDVVKTIKSSNGEALAIEADVSNSQQVTRMVAQTVSQFGHIDVLVNNAGVITAKPFFDLTVADFDLTVAVDVRASFLLSQAAAKRMRDQGNGGSIVNITSVHEHIPRPDFSAYAAAKAALGMLTKSLALELAQHDIRVNSVAPGVIATARNEADAESLNSEVPLGRPGKPEEVAALVAFLCSEDAAYITGASYIIDGGMMQQVVNLPAT